LPAGGAWPQRIDRLLPRTGVPAVVYFAVVIGLLLLAPHLPERAGLSADGLAALVASAWCGLNFWRWRHAHCAANPPDAATTASDVTRGLRRGLKCASQPPH
jgi:hypothetical protein